MASILHHSFRFGKPTLTLLNSGTRRGIAVFRVAGVLGQKCAGNLRTLPTVDKSLFLAANCHRTFAVEGVAVGFDTAAAMAGFFETTAGTMQAATGINHMYFLHDCHKKSNSLPAGSCRISSLPPQTAVNGGLHSIPVATIFLYTSSIFPLVEKAK